MPFQEQNRKLNSIKEKLKLPIIAAPMFLVSGIELVTAACKAGILAAFPCPNARTIEELETWMKELANLPEDAAPWIANMIVHQTYARFDEELALIEKYQPKIVITALGSPKRVTQQVHAYGGLVFADVNSISFAKKAAESGVDGLILVCAGAGGHTGMLSPFAFVDEVRKFWKGPLVVAGAISTGRAVYAAEVLGADFAYMGTRFIPTLESRAQSAYKEMLTHTSAEDIVLTAALTGVHGNFIRESLIAAHIPENTWEHKAKVDFSTMAAGSTVGKAWKDIWSAGQGVGHIHNILAVKDLIEELTKEYIDARRT